MNIKPIGGVYMLLFYLKEATTMKIGSLGNHTFEEGWYTYFGTAHGGGGVASRVGRHSRFLGDSKKSKWQIDWFREHAVLVEVWFAHVPKEFECRWSMFWARLGISSVPLKKMGSSDCRCCPAHFYKLKSRPTASALRHGFSNRELGMIQVCLLYTSPSPRD